MSTSFYLAKDLSAGDTVQGHVIRSVTNDGKTTTFQLDDDTVLSFAPNDEVVATKEGRGAMG